MDTESMSESGTMSTSGSLTEGDPIILALSLIDYTRKYVRAAKTVMYRTLIARHLDAYLTAANYQRPQLLHSQQLALIEGQKIGITEDQIRGQITKSITTPARNFKMFISQRHTTPESLQNAFIAQEFPEDPIYTNSVNVLQYVLTSYPPTYRFLKENIYYDVKARTVDHVKAFYRLAQLFSVLNIPVFNCFPLRRSLSPCYVTINTKILCFNIMSESLNNERPKLDYWREVVNLDAVAFKSQETDHRLAFRGTIQTDGVGVTVLKKRIDTKFKIQRKDQNPQKLRFIKPQQDSWTRTKKYRRILEAVKTDKIRALERSLVNSASVDITQYSNFLGARSTSFEQLSNFYTNTLTSHASRHSLRRKLRLCSYIQKQKGNEKPIKNMRQKFDVNAVMVMENWSAPIQDFMNRSVVLTFADS
ncbi:hypothetical protein G6F56_002805 [Rhizopus delemar]|nr:hypothetical protein G6F56_002805 [Rhizopus delemar]